MTIDWITVSAQIINFLILVWLLKRFLYQPIMRAVARREQRIADQLGETAMREKQADEQAQKFQAQIDQFEQQREELVTNAKQEIELNKRQLLDEAREEVTRIREQWQQQVEQEKEAFFNQLRHHTTEAIQVIARKALADLANTDLEARIIQSFFEQLKTLDEKSRNTLAGLSEPVQIVTTFKLDAAARNKISQMIEQYFTHATNVEYSESSKLLCGIECTIGGQRLGWHLFEYLEQLNNQIEKAFVATEQAGT